MSRRLAQNLARWPAICYHWGSPTPYWFIAMNLPPGGLDFWNASLVREMPCALVALDGEGRVSLWNPAAESLLGYSHAQALGRRWSEFVAAADGDAILLRHHLGHLVEVRQRLVANASRDSGPRTFFLEPAPNLIDATKLVINDVLQLLPAFFSIIGLDQRYRMVCRSCEILFGRPRREIEGLPVRTLFGEEAFAHVQPLLEKALAGTPADGEFRAVGADGQARFLRVHLQPIRRGDRLEAVFAFAYDVTELRQAEETLRDSEGRLKFLIANHPDLVVLVGRDFKLRFINHTEPDPQTPPESLLGIDVIDLSPPEYRGWLRGQYEQVWSTGTPMDVEVPIVWHGQVRWFSSRLAPLPNGDQPSVEMLVVSRETTRRVQMERALKQHEAHFKQFAEALEDVVWIHDANPERVVFVNRSFERLWGIPREEVYRDPRIWINTLHPDDRDRVTSMFLGLLNNPTGNFDVEYRLQSPTLGQRWIHDYGVAIRDDTGRALRITGVARDITARKLAEDERQAFQRKLLETQKLESLGVLAGGVAHDFNNLLAGILGSVNLAQGGHLEPAIRRHLEKIETTSLRAGDLCKQMLAYAGKGRLNVALFDLNSLIDEIAHLVHSSISKKVTLHSHLSAGLPSIRGDASQMRQVLLNLIINASEAFGDQVGDVRIATGEANLAPEDLWTFKFGNELTPGRYVFLEVSDNGPGMATEVVERIFEPFFTTKFVGRGLGLSAVQGIMRSHGGAIRVVSKVGMGTVFTLLLPPATEPSPPPEEDGRPEAPLCAAGLALVVDDEDIIRETLSLMLEGFGFKVITARDGAEAIQIFGRRHNELKVVLLDLTMPVLSGAEAHAELSRIDPAVPVIFMSGYMEQELADRCEGRTIAGFLQKPFRMEALERLIGAALANG